MIISRRMFLLGSTALAAMLSVPPLLYTKAAELALVGVEMPEGSRVLLAFQSNPIDNGWYMAHRDGWKRI